MSSLSTISSSNSSQKRLAAFAVVSDLCYSKQLNRDPRTTLTAFAKALATEKIAIARVLPGGKRVDHTLASAARSTLSLSTTSPKCPRDHKDFRKATRSAFS